MEKKAVRFPDFWSWPWVVNTGEFWGSNWIHLWFGASFSQVQIVAMGCAASVHSPTKPPAVQHYNFVGPDFHSPAHLEVADRSDLRGSFFGKGLGPVVATHFQNKSSDFLLKHVVQPMRLR